jgi:hypothetical protein
MNKNKFPRNGIICKNKWIALNHDFKKVVDYHKGIDSHTYFWDLMLEKNKSFASSI